MTEQIGNVSLDYKHYPGEDFYCDGEVEQELLEIVKTYSEVEFPAIIEERKSWPVLYHLSHLRENIVDWLPMDRSMKVLEVGSGCGAITGSLARKAGEVTCIDLSKQRSLINAYRHSDCENVTIHVGNFQDIEPELPCDYDYVCLIGVFEYGQSYIGGETPFTDFFKIIKKHVKQGGRLVIAIENKFGMKYWAGCREDHLGTFFSGIEDYPEGGGVRTFSRKALETIFEECGEKEYSFFYPYPDYKFMHTLFSDRRLPKVGELSDNLRNFDRDRMVLFDEKNAFDAIIKEDMFPFYSNSYVAVIGEIPELEYCRYSNDRSLETAIKTEIVTVGGEKKVRKYAMNTFGKEHIRRIYAAYGKLSKRYAGSRLFINVCRLEEDGDYPYVEFEYVEGRMLSELLDERLKKEDIEGFHTLFEEYVERIDYGNEEKIADYDMIFSNILVQGDTWTVIDYEWTEERQVATKEIAFRSLYCYLLENEKRNKCDMQWALEFLHITPEEAEEYRQQEVVFQKKVMGKRKSMPELRELIGGSLFTPAKWLGKIEENAGKDRVQVYEDKGAGFSEEESYFVDNAYVGEHQIELELKASGDVHKLRIDPAMDSCICKIKEFTVNGEAVDVSKKRVVTANGSLASGFTLVFATGDPNFTLNLDQFQKKAENVVYIELEIVRLDSGMCADIEKDLKEEDTPVIGKLKQQVRGKLEQKWESEYRLELNRKTETYDSFVKHLESMQTLEEVGPYPSMTVITWETLGKLDISRKDINIKEIFNFLDITSDIVIFVPESRGIADLTERELARIFNFYPEVQLVYGDEDEWNSNETIRMNPWYKPDFSPDTLGSYYYFGSLLAVRRELFERVALEKAWFADGDIYGAEVTDLETAVATGKKRLYALALQCALSLSRKEVYHCQKILYHSHNIKYWGMEEEYTLLREQYRQARPRIREKGVSIIVPSKDNPQVLENCIASIHKWTKDVDYEIIVVDNGSSPENKEQIEKLKIKYRFNYIYFPMEFNFSTMCNMGAKNSDKEHLLFLNDDCEVRQSKWLREMVDTARLQSVGAVGVKLYYPNSKTIQHCGIYGLHLGPVHKLQFKEDIRSYYDRRNKDTRNVLAVTAACLMVKKSLFEAAGGFYEGLRVAFNDVDFCYRLHEMGYDNVVLNEVHLWHHESLSRGNDESPEKLERLMGEKKQLWGRYPELWNKDPYYHPLLTSEILDINFSCKYEYPNDGNGSQQGEIPDVQTPEHMELSKKVRVDNCLAVVLEFAGRAEDWNFEASTEGMKNKIRIYFQGNALVLGSNNACYENHILLRHTETGVLYGVTPERVYRPDVVANVEGQVNVELSGFACYVDAEKLPKGTYEIAVLAEDKISHQSILRPTSRVVEI